MTNILIISHTLIPSVLLCGHSQLSLLKQKGIIDYQFSRARHLSSKLLTWADIVIFLRSESGLEAYASRVCKQAGKHLVYVLDDDLLNIPDYLSSAKYYLRPEIQNNIRTIMSNCDTFLTSSPVMLQKYGSSFKNAFQIHEPSLNAISHKQENDKTIIGFAGSIDRSKDLNIILEDSLVKILKEYDDKVEIEFMGAKPDIVEKNNLNYIPYTDSYEKYTDVIKERNWDIGLAPMPITEFHKCKYFNKYVEYASFGIAGIYSNTEPYTFGIKDKENGLLVDNNTDDWYKAIKLLIEDQSLRKKISDNCIKEANTIYSLDVLADDYLDKIMVDYKEVENKQEIKGVLKYRIISFINQLFNKMKSEGLHFPIWVIKTIFNKLQGK